MSSHDHLSSQSPIPGQVELFGIGKYDEVSYITEAAPSEDSQPQSPFPEGGVSVSVAERAKHLDVALGHLATGSRSTGFIKRQKFADASHIKQHYGSELGRVNAFVDDNAENYMKLVRSEMGQIYGDKDKMLEAGLARKEEVDGDFNLAVSMLRYHYGGAKHRAERDKYRKQLKTSVGIIEGTIEPKRRKLPVEKALVPDSQPIDELIEPATLELQPLDTRKKLIALRDDSKAGFLPSTHAEKNEAIALLDYHNNANYPNGINDHLQEIYDHQIKLAFKKSKAQREATSQGKPIEGEPIVSKVAYAEQSRTSLIYAYGDFRDNAKAQLKHLQELQMIVDSCPNPNVLIQDEAGDYHESYPALVQYMDLLALRENEKSTTTYDPLRTIEDRQALQPFANKHKTVSDVYTNDAVDTKVEEHTAVTIAQLTVGQLRSIIPGVIESQANRGAFWESRLREIRGNNTAKNILRVAQSLQ